MTYTQAIRQRLPAFTASRLMPTCGISLVFLLLAHKNPGDLALFAYLLAATSVVSAFFPLLLATLGNNTAASANDPSGRRELFCAGFTLALGIGALATLACVLLLILIRQTGHAVQWRSDQFWTLALLYIPALPLLTLNTCLQLFQEATGNASQCAKAKTRVTVMCGGLLIALYATSDAGTFTYVAMAYFVISELLTFLLLIRLSRGQRYISLSQARQRAGDLLRGGAPVAAGMSGQKVFYYLLTERLASLDSHLVAELSVFMTVAGILLIPSFALAQIHSLLISRDPQLSKPHLISGIAWTLGIAAVIATVLWPLGPYLFLAAGGSTLDYSPRLNGALMFYLTASALLSLTLAQLRARGETLGPQLWVNLITLGVLTPLLYQIPFANPHIETFLLLLSSAILACAACLLTRIRAIHNATPAAQTT